MRATKNWSDFSSASEIAKRAGGRRRYNAQRQAKALTRRLAILELFGAQVILNPHGSQSILASHFGVNRSTICRDIEAIRQEWRHQHVCPDCGRCNLGWSFGKQAALNKRLKRYLPNVGSNCCLQGFLQREASRKKKRLSRQELRFKSAIEAL